EAAESLPQFKLPLAPYASLGAGKVDADDSARLSIYVEDDDDGRATWTFGIAVNAGSQAPEPTTQE
ncbi:MAG: hypothetical protein QGG40_21570, partial [Myxococcota bacterium]|nr:hypothetical protein [Myxococcota bacterium]